MDLMGASVWMPTPLNDKVKEHGITSLNSTELAALPLETLITREPGVVVSVDPQGWVMVDRGQFGQFGYPASMLRQATP